MRIRVINYVVRTVKKNDVRLSIEFRIEFADGNVIDTSANIQLYPLLYFVGKVPDVTFSMLYLSAIVYAIDRTVERKKYSINGWSREFDVDILIPEYQYFCDNSERINKMLSFLTGDYWNCHFVDSFEIVYPPQQQDLINLYEGINQVNLFSGGMDSLIGAIDYLSNHQNGKLCVVSHYDRNMPGPRKDQNRVIASLRQKYDQNICVIQSVMISPQLSREPSSRSRSMMFISLALIVATYANCDLIIPENGSVSLNYPLSASRRASCSTRTTHPVFIRQYQNLVDCLGINIRLYNPYEKRTKGEMVRDCNDKVYLLQVVNLSNSCGKRGTHQYMFDNKRATHCGRCMPCMYRRASLNGEIDRTTYGNRLITLYNKSNNDVSNDFFAMLNFLKKSALTREEIYNELIIAGMSHFEDINDFIDLVIRTRAELATMVRLDADPIILQYMDWI